MDCFSTWVQVENVPVLNYSPLGWLSKSMVRGNPPNGHCFRCFTWLFILWKKRTKNNKNLWRLNIMLFFSKRVFYNVKACLISPNPFQMDSHGSWVKEANSQHCLLALCDLDPPEPCGHPCTHCGGALWDYSSLLPSTWVSPSYRCTSEICPPSFLTCWALLKLQVFSWNFTFLGNFSRSQKSCIFYDKDNNASWFIWAVQVFTSCLVTAPSHSLVSGIWSPHL